MSVRSEDAVTTTIDDVLNELDRRDLIAPPDMNELRRRAATAHALIRALLSEGWTRSAYEGARDDRSANIDRLFKEWDDALEALDRAMAAFPATGSNP